MSSIKEITTFLETCKGYYQNTFYQSFDIYSYHGENSAIPLHTRNLYITILEKVKSLFLNPETSMPSNFFSELFNLINIISSCLEDVPLTDTITYYSNNSISKFAMTLSNSSNYKETLYKIRSFLGMIFLQLFNISNQMISSLSQSIIENNIEMYYGLIQQNDYQDFYNLFFQTDFTQYFNNISIPKNSVMLNTDIQIYTYAYFISVISEHLVDISEQFQAENDKIILMVLMSYGHKIYNEKYKPFLSECIQIIFSQIDFHSSVNKWAIYNIMKVFSMNYSINYDFLKFFQEELIQRFSLQRNSRFIKKSFASKGKDLLAGNKKQIAGVEIDKSKKIVKFLQNFKWINVDKVKEVTDMFINEIKYINDEIDKINSLISS